MSYTSMIIQDAPIGFWPLDSQSAGTLPEATGRSGAGSVSAAANTKPVVSQSGGAQRITGAGITVPNSSILTLGTEQKPFSLETWIKPENSAGTGTLWGRGTFGVNIAGNSLSVVFFGFTLEYLAFDPNEIYHLVLVYDTKSLTLFVNGIAVDSVTFDSVTFEGETDFSFTAASGFAYSIDAIAIYGIPLRGIDIARHYREGTTYLDVLALGANKFSTRFKFWDQYADVYTTKVFDSEDSWNLGTVSDHADVDEALTSTFDATLDTYGAGTWQYLLHIEPEATTLDSGRVSWDASDDSGLITVELSEDGGTTWAVLTNGSYPIPVGFDLTNGADLLFRVSFDPSADQLAIYRLSVVLYRSRSVKASNNDIVAVINPASSSQTVSEFDYEPSAYRDKDGYLSFANDGRITIGPDAAFGDYQATEFTVKTTGTPVAGNILSGNAGAGQPAVAINASGQWVASNLTALYVDGVSVSVTSAVTLTPNVFHHVIAVFAPFTGSLYLVDGVQARVGYAAVYYDDLFPAEAKAIYDAWTGAIPQRITDDSVITATEHDLGTGPVNAYSYNWSAPSS